MISCQQKLFPIKKKLITITENNVLIKKEIEGCLKIFWQTFVSDIREIVCLFGTAKLLFLEKLSLLFVESVV